MASQVKARYPFPGGQVLEIAQGDITAEDVEAIVNAANTMLQHGGGVAGAILRKGGAQIQAESDAWVQQFGPVTHAKPAYTRAGRLPFRYIIHAVGPIWGEGDEECKLSAAILGSLRLAETLGIRSLAFPAISTGIFGVPKDLAARVFLHTIADYFTQSPNSPLSLVRITLYDAPTLEVFLEALETWRKSKPPSS
ncbi:macro domain-containing protein [uncultured Thermanaerothrix sp.]|uniref:macro domain-containing protein n=1 Tax=uncultured Thermanaerothrix sp. TaxID=1195149 RepID=UPI0026047ABE|nr:macro domain-containing protein [uncultured Thermanaerothrix sp.]